ncbi:MAG: alkaline phosphatase [Paludibacter sp.]|nr:alkaline phosphatase [Paludibacter sp.]
MKTYYKRLIPCLLLLILSITLTGQSPKYIFFYIGDGLSFNHVEAALVFQSKNVADHTPSLVFDRFPFTGIVNTRAASDYITDSSAGGTALASGVRINNTALGVDPDNEPVYSIIHKLQKYNWSTGVVTSTSVDDGTPASFYAHALDRNSYYNIGTQAAKSGINFLAGGGLKAYTNKDNPDDPHLLDVFKKNGYQVFKGLDDFNKSKRKGNNILLIPDRIYPFPYVSLPYAIDRQPDELSLSDLTVTAINYLEKKKKGKFILVVEGGRIDHASHTNDGATVILEVIDLAKSVQHAYDFYLRYPQETLIIVTSDHETGGLGLGNYDLNLHVQLLANQKISLASLTSWISELKKQTPNTVQWEDIVQILKDNLGFWTNIPISSEDENKLKAEFKKTFIDHDEKQVVTWYSKDEPLAVAAVGILNRMSQLGWSTTSHSGTPVPVYAIGAGAEHFTGSMLNTDIPKKIEKLIQ